MNEDYDILMGPGGPIAQHLGEGFEARDPQIRMARAVDDAMSTNSHLFVEAGTGVGKSFAYLVPSILRAIERDETVVVATNTIALQEQLVSKDIPVLQEALAHHGSIKSVLVKGRGNYMSIRRLKLASQRRNKLLSDAASRRSLDVIEDWAYRTEDGTLSTLPPIERQGVWSHAQSDSGNCMGRKCPHHNECFYQSARREMEGARLLVCNHALFFSDLALRSRGTGFLPEYDHVVLDEAHGVEDSAADHFGISLSEGRVSFLLRQLFVERTQTGYLPQLALQVPEIEPIDKAIALTRRARASSDAFFDALHHKVQTGNLGSGRIREPNIIPNELTPIMNELSVRLKRLRDMVPNEPDRFELNAYAMRASEIADHAEALIEQTIEGCVYWAESSDAPGRGGVRVTIACSPVEVAPLLKAHLFMEDCSVVLTSATLTTREVDDDETPEHAETAFAHTISRLGAEGARALQLGSPFDYAKQVEVYVDTSVPNPRSTNDSGETHESAIASRIRDQIHETDGGVFALFTSFKLLHSTARTLKPGLESEGYDVFVQGQSGPRTQILDAFRNTNRGVLFGAASFWQGVDVRGHTLRNVIITRLPFDPPDRPIVEARGEMIRERGGDPFRDDALPRAVIRFKQGFGRLIRSGSDRGRVVVLDPRLVTTGYGRAFRAAIPNGVELIRTGTPTQGRN